MSSQPEPAKLPLAGALLAISWVLVTVFVMRTLFFFPGLPRNMSFGPIAASALVDLSIWLLFAWPIVRLSRRFRFDAGRWLGGIPLHFLFALLLVTLHASVRVAMGRVPGIPETSMVSALYGQAQANFLTYWVVVGATNLVDYYQRYRQRDTRALQLEAQAAQLETRLVQAQLDALQMQLQPHFLFNTMNAISAFIREEPARAELMLERLGEMLRTVLEAAKSKEVALDAELAFIDRYLQIQQERFGARLHVVRQIDAAARTAAVPTLILLPLVENAIQHGIAARIEGGVLTLSAHVEAGDVILSVRDHGRGPRSPSPSGTGIGLANTRARIEQLYGSRGALEMGEPGGDGYIVRVRLPLKSLEVAV